MKKTIYPYSYLLSSLGFTLYTKSSCDYDREKMSKYIGQTMNSNKFKKIFPNYKAIKIIENNINDFQYKVGINVNDECFKPNGFCNGGGVYFTDISDMNINDMEKYISDYTDKIQQKIEHDLPR